MKDVFVFCNKLFAVFPNRHIDGAKESRRIDLLFGTNSKYLLSPVCSESLSFIMKQIIKDNTSMAILSSQAETKTWSDHEMCVADIRAKENQDILQIDTIASVARQINLRYSQLSLNSGVIMMAIMVTKPKDTLNMSKDEIDSVLSVALFITNLDTSDVSDLVYMYPLFFLNY